VTTVDLCAFDDLEPGTARRFDVGKIAISVVRIDDDVYVIGDRCTHENVSLSEGEVDVEERTIECWKHGSLFDLATGKPLSLPATKPTPTYEARVADGRLVVEVPE
jgi:3-phenylpropionate/trans-cinnamate dioxygenase ferredoxin subunit